MIKDRLKILLTFLLACYVLFSLPVLLTLYSRYDISSFGEKLELGTQLPKKIKEIRQITPDYIFIGNSMVYSRIDVEKFNELTGKKCMLITQGGSLSSCWHLFLKNIVSAVEVNPDAIFIFFRDYELINPKASTTGENYRRLNWYSTKNEEVLDRLIFPDNKSKEREEKKLSDNLIFLNSFYYRFTSFLKSIYPASPRWKDKNSKYSELITNYLIKSEVKFNKESVNEIFALKNFRSVETDGENAVKNKKINTNFQAGVKDSFLPYMIENAKKHTKKVVFVRVQNRPTKDGPRPQSAQLLAYMEELKKYLSDNDCFFYDFTGDPRITLDMYGSGDHIADEKKPYYTEIFVEKVKEVLK